MKRTTAASLTVLVGVVLIVAVPAFIVLWAPWLSFGLYTIAIGVYVGGLLIAVGVYVYLQSMSTAPAVPVTKPCPQCGRSNRPTNKFCDKCGSMLSTGGS